MLAGIPVDYRLVLEEDFVLASGSPPQTFGVRGDAVGCLMAR
jgi:hypothetical protein